MIRLLFFFSLLCVSLFSGRGFCSEEEEEVISEEKNKSRIEHLRMTLYKTCGFIEVKSEFIECMEDKGYEKGLCNQFLGPKGRPAPLDDNSLADLLEVYPRDISYEEEEEAALEEEARKQTTFYWTIAGVSVSIIAAIGGVVYYLKRNGNKEKEAQE